MARQDHDGVLWAVIWAGWPNREPGWPAILEGVAVLRVKGAETNIWLPGPARRPRPLALPAKEPAAAAAPAPTQTEAQVTAKPAGKPQTPDGQHGGMVAHRQPRVAPLANPGTPALGTPPPRGRPRSRISGRKA